MSKTQLVWLLICISGFGFSFRKGPIYALLTYIFVYYTQYSWGDRLVFGGFQRWSMLASVVLFLSWFMHRNTRPVPTFKNSQLKFLIFFIINMLLVSLSAVDPEASWEATFEFCKLTLLYYLITKVVVSKQFYNYFLWMQLWGNFHLGWEAFRHGKTIGGRLENIGVPGSEGSNFLGNLLLFIFPFLGKFTLFGNKWERIAGFFAAPFIVDAFIKANSRACFLGLIVMGIVLPLISIRGMRGKLFKGGVLGIILIAMLAGNQFVERMNTIDNYEEDGSATGRLTSWLGALELLQDYPFGAGGDAFIYLSPIYIPEVVAAHGGENRSVHNTYLMIATNWGIQGLILFLLFLGSTVMELHKIRGRTAVGDDFMFHKESVFIETAILGYLFAIIFGNRIYAELLYCYCALTVALSHIQQRHIAEYLKQRTSEIK